MHSRQAEKHEPKVGWALGDVEVTKNPSLRVSKRVGEGFLGKTEEYYRDGGAVVGRDHTEKFWQRGDTVRGPVCQTV